MKFFLFTVTFAILITAGIFIPQHSARAVSSTIISTSLSTTNTSHNGTTFTNVFTSSSTGYAFYVNAGSQAAFKKTTNGGTTWSAEKVIDLQTDVLRVAVWYDRWTPGNTTGTLINVATIDSGSDDEWYSKLDTSNDSTSTPIDISAATQGGRFTAGATLQSITRGEDNTLYEGVYNTQDNYVMKCATSCATVAANWTEAGTSTDLGTPANDWMTLLPLQGGNILNIRAVIANPGTWESKIWSPASSTWSASWTVFDAACKVNSTYDGGFGAAVNNISNDVYLAYACNNKTLTTGTGAIRAETYDTSSSTWNHDADIETSSTLGITGVKLGLDINTGNVYVVYSGQTTPGTAATANVYYKVSTSTTMSAWGSRQGPINQTTTDIYGARIDGMSNAILYATWVDGAASSLNGQTIALFSSNTFSENDYRFFQNQDSAQVGTWFDNQNASSVIPTAGSPFRLRMLVNVGGGGIDIDAQNFKLQYATSSSGACLTNFSDGTYIDVGTATSSPISFYNNPTPANGAALTANAQDPIDGTNVIVNETYVEQNTFTNDIAKIFGGQDGKWDFSLINNSGASGNNYCFRIIKSDGSLLDTYNIVASAQVDYAPTISGVTLNGGNSISLIEGTTTSIAATATVSDANGGTDIFYVTGMLYRTSLGPACTLDNNNCYQGTFSNCNIDSCAGNTCAVDCTYKVAYYAQPTDAGTPWAGDSWTALITASDTVLSGKTATSTGVPLLSLLAFTTTSTINYGSFSQGQSMSTLTASSVIVSSGNTAMNVKVYGTNMTSGSFSIAVGQQRFATSSISYSSGTTLLVNPGSTLPINLPKPTSSVSNPKSSLFWGISIPSGQMATSYTGFNSFIGVVASLPWP